MSEIRVNAVKNTGGVERYLAQAWVNFNGAGTVAIRASGNVTSITDNGVGDYTVNFSSALADANYAVVGSGRPNTQYLIGVQVKTGTVPTTGAVNISTGSYASAFVDADYICAAVFR